MYIYIYYIYTLYLQVPLPAVCSHILPLICWLVFSITSAAVQDDVSPSFNDDLVFELSLAKTSSFLGGWVDGVRNVHPMVTFPCNSASGYKQKTPFLELGYK